VCAVIVGILWEHVGKRNRIATASPPLNHRMDEFTAKRIPCIGFLSVNNQQEG
jgi:hypothetical protein